MQQARQLMCDPRTLQPNPWNPNSVGPEAERKLEESMRRFGCYKPIIVRSLPGGALQIIGGQHRAQTAARLGLAEVPVIDLGAIDDERAKAIGLVDNARYGEDDPLLLGALLRELGVEDALAYLPMVEGDLAGMLAAEDIDLDDLDVRGEDDDAPAPKAERAPLTHAVMRFKVGIAEQEGVEGYIKAVIAKQGLKEGDSMLAIIAAAKEQGL